MIVQRGFKYKLCPTQTQYKALCQHGGNTRFVWNLFLKENSEYYKQTGKFKFFYDLANELPEIKQKYPFLLESFAQSLQGVAKNFDYALRMSFSGRGFPLFKKKSNMRDSFICPQNWRFGKNFVFIPKIGEVKWIKHRAMKGKPKFITITQDGLNWYCSVLCEYEVPGPEEIKSNNNIVGIDVGLKSFATLSDGESIASKKFQSKYAKKLKKENKSLSRKKYGSSNWFKQKCKVRLIHKKIKNSRIDFLHKTSDLIVKNYDGIIVENLNIYELISLGNGNTKSILDSAWGEFFRQIEYKCKFRSKFFRQVGEFFPSTKKCSKCGSIKKMKLNERTYVCPKCGLTLNRDLNAAINIKNEGLSTLGHSGIKAC